MYVVTHHGCKPERLATPLLGRRPYPIVRGCVCALLSPCSEHLRNVLSQDLDRVLGDSEYDFRQLIDPNLNYRFYSDLGLAALVQNGKVIELVIGQIPEEKRGNLTLF